MQPTEFCKYIDTKGRAHNAQVTAVRPGQVFKADDRGMTTTEVIHDEPVIDVTFVNPTTGKSEPVLGLVHMSHPSKQETNVSLPTIHLHCWRRLHEAHTEPAEDHPIFDHPHEQTKVDGFGKPIPKARPKHEAHIAAHRASLPSEQVAEISEAEKNHLQLANEQREKDPAYKLPQHQGSSVNQQPITSGRATVGEGHHPGNPNSIHFPFVCQSCGKDVTRLASHHGGKQWEQFQGVKDVNSGDGGTMPGTWVEHVCKTEDIAAHHAKVNAPKQVPAIELSPSERLAAGENLAPEIKDKQPEPDVIAELEKAPPAPKETEEKPPTDAA